MEAQPKKLICLCAYWGNIETVRCEKWNPVACWGRDLREVHIIPTVLGLCLEVYLRQPCSYCIYNTAMLGRLAAR